MILFWMLLAIIILYVVIKIGDRAENGATVKKRSVKTDKFKY